MQNFFLFFFQFTIFLKCPQAPCRSLTLLWKSGLGFHPQTIKRPKRGRRWGLKRNLWCTIPWNGSVEAFVLAGGRADLGGGLAVWTSFIFQFILNNGFRLAVRVGVHQIKKIALNYPINIIIFAAPHRHYIMKQRGFYPAPGSSHASKWKLDCHNAAFQMKNRGRDEGNHVFMVQLIIPSYTRTV